ncbi:MAG: outer membrane protein assembly factor BamD [Bacteroidota bacterium]
MFSKGIKSWYILLFAVLITACTGYNKVVKSTDSEFKYKKAVQYYEEKKYGLAYPLFEDLIPVFRGTTKGEYVAYYRAMCYYKLEDFPSAGILLKTFGKTFPKSELAEESTFLGAMCTFYQSPKYSLDQSETHNALNDFQLFLNRYPSTPKRDTVNLMMIQCREKLERKSFEIAELYFQTEHYKSAVIAFENTLKDYPNTKYEEQLLLMMVEANYNLATNSVQEKTRERLEATVKAYQRYIDKYSQSKSAKQAETFYKLAVLQLEKINKQQLSAL